MVDASAYGFPQEEAGFILAYGPGTPGHEAITNGHPPESWLEEEGVLARSLQFCQLNERVISVRF